MRRHRQVRLHRCHEHSTRDLFPIGHKWDEDRQRVFQRLVQSQTLQQLEDGLHEEWRELRNVKAKTVIYLMRHSCKLEWTRTLI